LQSRRQLKSQLLKRPKSVQGQLRQPARINWSRNNKLIEFKEVALAVKQASDWHTAAALASVVRVRGSSPRHNGARMLIWPDGQVTGTIGGGSMEYQVIQDAQQAVTEGKAGLYNYVFDASGRPGSVGLCGGSVDIYIDPQIERFVEPAWRAVQALERGERLALATLIPSARAPQDLDQPYGLYWPDGRKFASGETNELGRRIQAEAQAALAERESRLIPLEGITTPDTRALALHIEVLDPDPTLLILGAGHVAQPLAVIGSMLGFRVCVVDDRPEWANRQRFQSAAEIAVIDYEPVHEILAPIPIPMNRETYVVIATWGYDLPCMEQALRQSPAYIGLVSSPTKARVLFRRLLQAGFSQQAIQSIYTPIGLDIGAESPAEIAVSILAEILAVRSGKSGQFLKQVRGARIRSLFSAASASSQAEPV
jgi:xanthine dehydrogenase accessory factor